MNNPNTLSGPSSTDSTPQSPNQLSTNSAQAHIPKCAICGNTCVNLAWTDRVNHFNSCWKNLQSRTAQTPNQKQSLHNILLARLRSPPPPPIYHTPPPPSPPSPSSTITDPSSSSSDDDFSPTACPLCNRDLSTATSVPRFNHLITCIGLFRPRSCPLCYTLFSHTKGDFFDIAEHIQACQSGTSDEEAFEALASAWAGQQEVVQRTLAKTIGPRKDWDASERRWRYEEKKGRGLVKTPLRKSVGNLLGEEVPLRAFETGDGRLGRAADEAGRTGVVRPPPGFTFPPMYSMADFDLVLQGDGEVV